MLASTKTAEYTIREHNGHLLASVNGSCLLVNTGSPRTVTRSGQGEYLGSSGAVPTSWLGISIDQIASWADVEIDGILGIDLLSQTNLLFDLDRYNLELDPVIGDTWAPVALDRVFGLLVVQMLRARGCQQIVAVDIDPDKLKLAGRLGADIGLNPSQDDVTSQIKKSTDQRGADVAFDAVGIDVSFKTALGSLRKGGALTLIGNLFSEIIKVIGLKLLVIYRFRFLFTISSRGGRNRFPRPNGPST